MAHRDDALCLRQMLERADEAVHLTKDHARADLDSNQLLSLALLQLLMMVGEAADRVSPARRQRHLEIPWEQIIALRDRVIRGYDTIDFDILWKIVTADLTPLVAALKKALESGEE